MLTISSISNASVSIELRCKCCSNRFFLFDDGVVSDESVSDGLKQ